MCEAVNMEDKPAAGEAGEKTAALFLNNFICLCKPTAARRAATPQAPHLGRAPQLRRAPRRTLAAAPPRRVSPTPAGRDARPKPSVQRLNKFCSPLQQAL